jgi:hypothetical protein
MFNKTRRNLTVVYWAPTSYVLEQEDSWAMLFSEPKKVLNVLRSDRNQTLKENNFFQCPAVKESFENIFAVYCEVDDEATLPEGIESQTDPLPVELLKKIDSKIPFVSMRHSSLNQYFSISYNMDWIFVSDKPLNATFTAPYFPNVSPAPGTFLASGSFDIGQWFRPFFLDYHFPFGTKKLSFKKGDPLFFLNLHTEDEIVFKRFSMTPRIRAILRECVSSPSRYGKFIPLKQKYEMSKKSELNKQILSEIKKNLID